MNQKILQLIVFIGFICFFVVSCAPPGEKSKSAGEGSATIKDGGAQVSDTPDPNVQGTHLFAFRFKPRGEAGCPDSVDQYDRQAIEVVHDDNPAKLKFIVFDKVDPGDVQYEYVVDLRCPVGAINRIQLKAAPFVLKDNCIVDVYYGLFNLQGQFLQSPPDSYTGLGKRVNYDAFELSLNGETQSDSFPYLGCGK